MTYPAKRGTQQQAESRRGDAPAFVCQRTFRPKNIELELAVGNQAVFRNISRRLHVAVGTPRRARSCHLQPMQTKELTAMGLFTKDIKTMEDLFVHTLRDIYYAEKQIVT